MMEFVSGDDDINYGKIKFLLQRLSATHLQGARTFFSLAMGSSSDASLNLCTLETKTSQMWLIMVNEWLVMVDSG